MDTSVSSLGFFLFLRCRYSAILFFGTVSSIAPTRAPIKLDYVIEFDLAASRCDHFAQMTHQYPRPQTPLPVSDAGIMLPIASPPVHDSGLWRKAAYVLGAALVAVFVWALLDTRWQLRQAIVDTRAQLYDAIVAIKESNEHNATRLLDLEKWRAQEEAKERARKEEHDREMLRYKNLRGRWEQREFPGEEGVGESTDRRRQP